MKLTLEHIPDGTDEVIIRYRQRTDCINSLIKIIEQHGSRIPASNDRGEYSLAPSQVLYLESVDDRVFVYTGTDVGRTPLTLASAAEAFADEGFFRCSKSMVLNIYHIDCLRSIPGSRAEVTMDNGERVVISRRYVKELRSVLKGEDR